MFIPTLWRRSSWGVSLRPGEVRIIGGQWRRTPIRVIDMQGLRPTPDRVRETLFNWLGQDLTGYSCADLFAGTGALGFEAASRGATKVWIFEQSPPLIELLEKLKSKLKAEAVQIKKGEGVSLLKGLPPNSMDVIFIDPPFDTKNLYELALGAASDQLAQGGVIYLESAKKFDNEHLLSYGLSVFKHLKAGAVHAHLLKRLD